MNSSLVIILIAAVLIALIVIVASVLLIRNNDSPEADSGPLMKTTTVQTTTTKSIVVPDANYNTVKLLYDGNGYVNGVQMTIHGTFDKISSDAMVLVTIPCDTHYEQYDDDGRRYRDVDLSEYNYWGFNLSDKTNEYTFYRTYYDKYGEEISELYCDNFNEPAKDELGTVDVKMGADKCTVTVKFDGQHPTEPGNVKSVDISVSDDALVNSSTGAGNKDWYDSRDIT